MIQQSKLQPPGTDSTVNCIYYFFLPFFFHKKVQVETPFFSSEILL